jgi:hypothetical protein
MAEAQSPPGTSGYAQFPSHAAIDASAVQPGYAYPYPAISPFDHVFESTYNDRGQWITEQSNDSYNRYSFSVEWIYAMIKGPSSDPVSYDQASIPQMYFDLVDDVEDAMPIDNDPGDPFDQTRTPLFILDEALQWNQGRGVYSPFDSGLLDASRSSGLQLKFNVERPDGIGFELGGLGIWPSVEAKETGVPILRVGPEGPAGSVSWIQDQVYGHPSDQIYGAPGLAGTSSGPFNDLATDYVDMDSVGVFNPGIRLFDGSTLGTIQRFDAYMRTEIISELYGAHANILHNATRQIGPFTVRPLFGARYLNSRELFRVEGHDSGADYAVNLSVEGITDPEERDALLPGGAEDTGDLVRSPYRAYIDSETVTHLAGPEAGWQYATAGEFFALVGETRIGVMGARQQQELWTQGIGQAYLINDLDPPDGFAGFNPLYDPFLETYDKDETSYVTPTFIQSFNTTTRPFAYVPILRSHRFFREANLKAGWTFLLIGQMQRPNEQIVYQSGNGTITPEFLTDNPTMQYFDSIGDPSLKPEVRKDRSVYFVNYFNLGLEWEF